VRSVDLPAALAQKPKPVISPDPLPRFNVGQKVDHTRRNDVLPGIADRLSRAPLNMDNKAFGKMKRGKLKPEARIDLHGMTMDQAHPELMGFILNSQAMGRRLVLVITGKGKLRDEGGPMPARHGILRHQVPQWMALPPISQAILQVTPAHLTHGGHGAYYVYLRRIR
jgi:DNA-nicking Smr family endonuclease